MSDIRRLQRNESRESRSATRKPLGSEIIRNRVDQLLQTTSTAVSADPEVTTTNKPRNPSAFPREFVTGSSSIQAKLQGMDTSFGEGTLSKGRRARVSAPHLAANRDKQENGAPIVASKSLGSTSTVHPISTLDAAPSHLRAKSGTSVSKHPPRQRQANYHDGSADNYTRDEVRQPIPAQHAFTGPLAVSEFERLKKEVQTLREALHESKKTSRRYHKKVEDSTAELSTALTIINEKDAELSVIKTKHKESQEMLSTIEASVQCQICFDLPDKPYALAPCGHVLCLLCLQQWFRKAPSSLDDVDLDDHDRNDTLMRSKTCPACRAIVRHRPVPIFMVKAVSAALKSTNPTAAVQLGSRHIIDAIEDPWEGIFPSSDEENESEDSYETDEGSVEAIHGWYSATVHEIADESDEEPEGEDESSEGEMEGDSSSEEEWERPLFAASRWAHPRTIEQPHYFTTNS